MDEKDMDSYLTENETLEDIYEYADYIVCQE